MDSPSSSVRLLTYNNARRTTIEHLEDLRDSICKEGDVALQRASLPLGFPKTHFNVMISLSWMESGALVEDTVEFSNTDSRGARSWIQPVKWRVISTGKLHRIKFAFEFLISSQCRTISWRNTWLRRDRSSSLLRYSSIVRHICPLHTKTNDHVN